MRKSLVTLVLICVIPFFITAHTGAKVYFTTGLKIGDVTENSAIILVRLCAESAPMPVRHGRENGAFSHPTDFDDSMPVDQMEGAVKGTKGEVMITLISDTHELKSYWQKVTSKTDFILKKKFDKLKPNTFYDVVISGRKNKRASTSKIKGTFRTAPLSNEVKPVFFTSSTCQYYWSHDDSIRGFKSYDSMKELQPDFHCQTGDFIYYDKPGPLAKNIEQARHKWHAMNSWPSLVDFYSHTTLYQQKDDHDLLKDDAGPTSTPYGDLTYEDGLAIWREQVPIIGTPYKTFRWGKDLQIWRVEGREYRSINKSPDGADKTIWGKEQIAWFKETVEASNATFKILVSPTPIVGPDRAKGKYDNHSNPSFQTEGTWLRQYLADQGVFVINGDRHWQYVSVDPVTGLKEFSQGPISDTHAQGWNPNDRRPEHKFLRVKGGFLGVKVSRKDNQPVIEFIHYDVDGNVVNEESFDGRE